MVQRTVMTGKSIARGDAVKAQEAADTNANTDYETVLTATSGTSKIVGVAAHSADSGEDVLLIKATKNTLFYAPTGATTGWSSTSMGFGTAADYSTEGQKIAAAASTNVDAFVVLGIVDGSTDGTAGNNVYGYFINSDYDVTS
jgi:hypothetical protein